MVAEMSGNHGGKIDSAHNIIEQAKESGADAVKIQVYRPDTITLNSNKKDFQIPNSDPWADYKNLYNLYQYAHTPWEWIPELTEEASKVGIELFPSVFDHTSVEFMEKTGCNAYKVAAPEINDIPLLKVVAETQKPVIISTGQASIEDIDLAITTLNKNGCNEIILLKCTSAYPAPAESMNLRTIPDMQQRFNCLAGLSDHSTGIEIATASVAIGAKMIEKHFRLVEEKETVDSFFSLTPEKFNDMVSAVRTVEKALGKVKYSLTDEEARASTNRRSLYVSQAIQQGDKFTTENVKSVRPGYSLPPVEYEKILGKTATQDLDIGDRLDWSSFAA